jgi:hypothetical protein
MVIYRRQKPIIYYGGLNDRRHQKSQADGFPGLGFSICVHGDLKMLQKR